MVVEQDLLIHDIFSLSLIVHAIRPVGQVDGYLFIQFVPA